MFLLNSIIPIISMLISVAFYTMLERKILSYIQIRKGPNKVSFLGILQPFSDALKLFNKNLLLPEFSNTFMSSISPLLILFMSLIMILILPFMNISSFDNKNNILSFLIISSLSVYLIMMIGWSSNSKYSNLGTIRSVAQMISYEVSLFLIILFIASLSNSYNFTQISESQTMLWFLWGNIMIFMMWMMSCLAEVNRSPYDFAESESELVSGFNIEYMGGWFALIFLAEYMNMIILSMISTILFFKYINSPFSFFMMISITMMFLWIRGTFPRFRYDMLMYLSWKIFLPLILFICPVSMLCAFLNF